MKEIEEALIILRQRKQRQEPNFDFLQKVDDEKAQSQRRSQCTCHQYPVPLSRSQSTCAGLGESTRRDSEWARENTQLVIDAIQNQPGLSARGRRDDRVTTIEAFLLSLPSNRSIAFNERWIPIKRRIPRAPWRTLSYSIFGLNRSRSLESRFQQLLPISSRRRSLFRTLNDVAYGTRQYRIQEQPTKDASLSNDLIEDVIELERGQNLIEIHLSRASFTERALESFGKNSTPSTFCSIEFFEHELQMTPIMKSQTPEYNFTAQYIVNVDDFLLYYLQKEYTTIELHQAVGQSFQTVARCQLSLKQLVEGMPWASPEQRQCPALLL